MNQRHDRPTLAGLKNAALVLGLVAAAACGGGSPEPAKPRDANAVPAVPGPTPPVAATVEASVNARGLRATREIDYAKPSGRMRVVCVGGAATFGDGVSVGAAYPAWIERNMRGRGYDVEVLNGGKPGMGAAESLAQLEAELLKYEPDLVVVSVQGGEGSTTAADLRKIEDLLGSKKIVYVLLAVSDFSGVEGYTPKPPAVYVVPSNAALGIFTATHALVDTKGRWTEFAHKTMGNALAELIVGAPLICCAKGPVPQNP